MDVNLADAGLISSLVLAKIGTAKVTKCGLVEGVISQSYAEKQVKSNSMPAARERG